MCESDSSFNLIKNDFWEMDSFKIRLSFDLCEVINQNLLSKVIKIYEDTGEVKPDVYKSEKTSFSVNSKGIHIYFSIEHQMTGEQVKKKFVCILITSKLLESRYFEGITKDNINLIYDKIIAYNVVKFSYEDFLKGELVDVDFKKDRYIKDFRNVIQAIADMTKTEPQIFDKNNNQGIQFSERKETNINRKPFVKFYNKGKDLTDGGSKEFYSEFLFDEEHELKDLIRFEYTIKNKKHFKVFDINSTRLEFILCLSNEKKKEMFRAIVEKHIEIYDIKPVKLRDKMAPNDMIILNSINGWLQLEFSIDKIMDILLCGIEGRMAISRKRKEIRYLYDNHLKLSNVEKIRKGEVKATIENLLFS